MKHVKKFLESLVAAAGLIVLILAVILALPIAFIALILFTGLWIGYYPNPPILPWWTVPILVVLILTIVIYREKE